MLPLLPLGDVVAAGTSSNERKSSAAGAFDLADGLLVLAAAADEDEDEVALVASEPN